MPCFGRLSHKNTVFVVNDGLFFAGFSSPHWWHSLNTLFNLFFIAGSLYSMYLFLRLSCIFPTRVFRLPSTALNRRISRLDSESTLRTDQTFWREREVAIE